MMMMITAAGNNNKSTTIVVVTVLIFAVGIFLSQLQVAPPDENNNTASSSSSSSTKTLPARDSRNGVSPRPDSVVASHVFDRDEKGLWHPRLHYLNESLASVDQWLFNEDPRRPQKQAPYDQFLGVIRIPRTGSTSLLHFLKDTNGLHTMHHYLKVRVPADPTKSKIPEVDNPSCFFGAHPIYRQKPDKGQQCHNQLYSIEVSHWAKSLRLLREDDATQPRKVVLDMITMVRDPFDRYLSFFYYWRSSFPAWSNVFDAKSSVYAALVQGDFELFLKELANTQQQQQSSSSRAQSSTTSWFQYEFLSSNVDKAISLVQELRVLPLVTECFDASIWLLADQYPFFFPLQLETADFLQHGMYKHANQRNPKKDPPLNAQLQPMKADFDANQIRKVARESWLRDDYRFYEACLSVLQSVLQKVSSRSNGTIMDPKAIQDCLAQKIII